jgi:precorrin-3B methylase
MISTRSAERFFFREAQQNFYEAAKQQRSKISRGDPRIYGAAALE